jgi:hypothetical protein
MKNPFKKIPWRKVWSGAKKAIDIGSAFGVPGLDAVDMLIDAAESKFPNEPGETKLAYVEDLSDELLESELLDLSPAHRAAIKTARAEYIAAGVDYRDATARILAATEDLKAAFRTPPPPDPIPPTS